MSPPTPADDAPESGQPFPPDPEAPAPGRRRASFAALVWTWLPLATLAGVLAALGLVALRGAPPGPRRIEPASSSDLPEVVPPERTARVAARVVDAHGEPVADALVHLRSGDEPAWTTTDRDGRFSLEGLDPGPWRASVVARWYAPLTITLAPDEREIRLGEPLPEPPELLTLERARLIGRVEAAAPLSLEGAQLWLEPDQPIQTIDGPLPVRAMLQTDGSFRVEELVLGRYRVHVLPAWARGGSWPDLARPLPPPPSVAEEAVEAPLFVHERGGSSLAVSLVNGALAGRVLGPEGEPLVGALVTLAPADDPTRPWPPRASDALGRFEAADLPAGRWSVRARAGAALAERTFELSPGERLELELELRGP